MSQHLTQPFISIPPGSIKKQKSAHALECTPDWPVTCDVPGSVPVDLTFYKEHPEVSMMFR